MFWKRGPKERIYADAAAATPLSPAARRELLRLLDVYGNPSALHHEGVEAKRELERARASIAASVGAHADEIIFTGSGTEANNLALHAAKGHVITTAVEHSSVLEPLRASAARVTELEVSSEGLVAADTLAAALAQDTTLVSVQLVNSEVGTTQPVKEIAKILRRKKSSTIKDRPLYFHTDASQAPLWMDIKVDTLGVDLMTLDAQKVQGPKGVGCLYVRRGTPLEPLVRGGGQEAARRAGTENVPAIGSFAAALANAQADAAERALRTAAARDFLWSELVRLLPDIRLNGPALSARRVANNLNVSVPGLDAQMAVIALDALGIAVSTRSACDVGEAEPSRVIKAIGTPREFAGTAVRITLLPDATRAHAARIAAAFKEVADRYRK